MAEYNFEFGPFMLRVAIGDTEYPNTRILTETTDGSRVSKGWTEGQKTNGARYSYSVNNEEIAYIRGVFRGDQIFHISRVENVTEDRTNGKYIPTIFKAMEEDLVRHGVMHITTNAIPRLAPILVGRYGFRSTSRKKIANTDDYDPNKKVQKTFPLEKHL